MVETYTWNLPTPLKTPPKKRGVGNPFFFFSFFLQKCRLHFQNPSGIHTHTHTLFSEQLDRITYRRGVGTSPCSEYVNPPPPPFCVCFARWPVTEVSVLVARPVFRRNLLKSNWPTKIGSKDMDKCKKAFKPRLHISSQTNQVLRGGGMLKESLWHHKSRDISSLLNSAIDVCDSFFHPVGF